jgi:hypothetical protein
MPWRHENHLIGLVTTFMAVRVIVFCEHVEPSYFNCEQEMGTTIDPVCDLGSRVPLLCVASS